MNNEINEEIAEEISDYLFLDSKRYNHNLGGDE